MILEGKVVAGMGRAKTFVNMLALGHIYYQV